MVVLPSNEFIEFRDPGYYLAGTRISLDSIAYGVRRGQSAEEILDDFPVLDSREELDGAIAYIKAHSKEVDLYLAQEAQRWEELEKLNSPELIERIRKYREREDKGLKSA